MPGRESRPLPDSCSKLRGSPAANASSTLGVAPRPFDRITGRRAQTRPGSSTDATKLVNCHDRGGAPAIVPGIHATEGQFRPLDTRPDYRCYAHTARHRQSSGGLLQHRQEPLIMPDPRASCRGRIRLSVIAPDRRVGARLSRAPDVAGPLRPAASQLPRLRLSRVHYRHVLPGVRHDAARSSCPGPARRLAPRPRPPRRRRRSVGRPIPGHHQPPLYDRQIMASAMRRQR